MTALTTRRTCPYCGMSSKLGTLPVVATNTRFRRGDDDDEEDDRRKYPSSGVTPQGWIGPHPVLAWPQLQTGRKVAQRVVDEVLPKSLTPLSEAGATIDMPARLCTACKRPLPVDIDERDPLIIAVVGTSRSGKTHMLASMLHQASHDHGFQGVQCLEFAPDEFSAEVFDEEYYFPVFVDRQRLDGTAREEAGKRLLVYRVAFEGKDPYLLLFYDIAGETLSSVRARVEHADFLTRASGIIFLIDPVCLGAPENRPWRPAQHLAQFRRRNQADLLNACINLIPADRQTEIPVAITLSKADLVSEYLTWQPGVDQEHEVRTLLQACNAHDLLAATNRLGADMVSFHALAAIGSSPAENGELKVVEPFRCLDPLLAVLRRIPDATADD